MKFRLFCCLLLAGPVPVANLPARAQLIVAHRGASEDAPENTLSAFHLAWEQGADAIEGDCYLTSDKQIVFTHDDTTERVSGVKLTVAATKLKDLRGLDVGSWKAPRFFRERMPTLEEICETVPPGKVFYIEIKCGPEIVPRLKAALSKSSLTKHQIAIISFSRDVIQAAKLALPDIQCYWLFQFRQDETHGHWYPSTESVIATARQIGADGVDLKANMQLVNKRFVTACHQAGLSLHAWTVDEPVVAAQLRELGFASITTNRPGYLRAAMASTVPPAVPEATLSPAVEPPVVSTEGIGVE